MNGKEHLEKLTNTASELCNIQTGHNYWLTTINNALLSSFYHYIWAKSKQYPRSTNLSLVKSKARTCGHGKECTCDKNLQA